MKPAASLARTRAICGGKNKLRIVEERIAMHRRIYFFLPSLVVTMVFWRICIITVLLHTPWLWLTMVMVAKPWLICGYHSFLVSCVVKPWSISVRGGRLFIASLGLIYETNVRPKFGHMVVSTQNLEFINMDVSGGYDQISRQV